MIHRVVDVGLAGQEALLMNYLLQGSRALVGPPEPRDHQRTKVDHRLTRVVASYHTTRGARFLETANESLPSLQSLQYSRSDQLDREDQLDRPD